MTHHKKPCDAQWFHTSKNGDDDDELEFGIINDYNDGDKLMYTYMRTCCYYDYYYLLLLLFYYYVG
jgi:hypothetical protein